MTDSRVSAITLAVQPTQLWSWPGTANSPGRDLLQGRASRRLAAGRSHGHCWTRFFVFVRLGFQFGWDLSL